MSLSPAVATQTGQQQAVHPTLTHPIPPCAWHGQTVVRSNCSDSATGMTQLIVDALYGGVLLGCVASCSARALQLPVAQALNAAGLDFSRLTRVYVFFRRLLPLHIVHDLIALSE